MSENDEKKKPHVGSEGNEANFEIQFDNTIISKNGNSEKSANKKAELSKLGQAALEYLAKGFSIFPLWEKDKRPLLSNKTWHCTWQEYQKKLPSEEEVIQWWTKWPNANIGLITGSISEVIVLDIDGQEAIDYLKENSFELPYTPYVKTGKGYHYYFKHPMDGVLYKNFARSKIKLDLRGDGGYVVVPPSIHPDGGVYKWEEDVHEIFMEDTPEWLIHLITSKEESKEIPKKEFEKNEDGEFPPSNFNKICQHCLFIKNCVENAKTLSEPEWHSALSIALFCEDGEEHAHAISEPYEGYSYEETQKKLEKLKNYGPKTCLKIQEEHGIDVCGGCRFKDKITTPVVIGYPDLLEKAKKSVEEAIQKASQMDFDSEIMTDPEIIGSLAIVARRDPATFDFFKHEYQEKFKIGEKKLKNLIAQHRGEPMGRVVEHPKKKEDSERRVISLIQINDEEKFFYVWEMQGKQSYPERISNFVMTPIYALKDEEGNHLYTVKIENHLDSQVVTIDPKSLTSNGDFKKFCRQKGEFNWIGKPKHLDMLNDYLIAHECQKVHQIDYIGYNREHKCWIFPTHAFSNGQVYVADDKGLIHAEDKTFKVTDNPLLNVVRPIVETEPTQEKIQQYFQDIYKLYGNYGLLGIGWIVSGVQVHMFEKRMDTVQFPFLYATGIFQSGKTQFMKRMVELAGLKPKFDTNPTKDIWRKTVKAFGSLPINFDELRDTGKHGFFNQMRETINKTFDREEHKRGTIDPNSPLVYPTHAIVGFSGEVPTEDSAIMSRTIFVHSIKFTKDTKSFNRLARSISTATWIGQYLQKTSFEWEDIIFNAFQQALEEMDEFQIDTRELTNFALCVAGITLFLMIFKIPHADEVLKNLYSFIKENGEQGQKQTRENHPSVQYLTSLGVLSSSSFPAIIEGEHYIVRDEINGDGKTEKILYLAPGSCFAVFKEKTKDWDAFYTTSNKIKSDLDSFKFFTTVTKKIGKTAHRGAWRIQLDHPDLPPDIRSYFVTDEEHN